MPQGTLIFVSSVGLGASFSTVCKNIACYHVRKGLVLHMKFLKCINYEEAKYFFNFLFCHAFSEEEISDMRQQTQNTR
jgi:hypothetical protein